MGLISWSVVARTLATTCFLASTATAQIYAPGSPIVIDANFTLPAISTQAAATTLPDISDKAGLLALVTKTRPPAFDTVYDRCPVTCSESGPNPANWTRYHKVSRLALCNQTVLLDFNVQNPLNDPSTRVTISACVTSSNSSSTATLSGLKARDADNSCFPAANDKQIQVTLQEATLGSVGSAPEVVEAAQQLLNHLSQQNASCNSSVSFSGSGRATLGFYAGSQIQAQGLSTKILQQFIDEVSTNGASTSHIVQMCGAGELGADFAMGIAANLDDNHSLDFVQEAVASWSLGKCVKSSASQSMNLAQWNNATLWIPTLATNSTSSQFTNSSSTTSLTATKRAIFDRTTYCTTIQAVANDTCTTLAGKCGISAATFTTYNPSSTLCSTLIPGTHVCCSAGTMPNFSPVNNADGSCYTHLVVSGDTCSALGATYSLTTLQIEQFNANTWAYMGCADLLIGENICLSNGTAPMPAPIANAVCGPQVPGTVKPSDMTTLAGLNPCPLNACCDDWGQCGTTDEFCTVSYATGDWPGSAAAGQNGCISNCGTGIVIGSAPTQFRKVGYFEGFNGDRKCLHMNVTDINLGSYTHIHMAFATITDAFAVNVTGIQAEFNAFVKLTGVKKILSFGGWSFSTDADTYPIFRAAVTDADRTTFINNLVAFVAANNIDGLDFDWEYPGATDIPGVPAGSVTDSTNYFVFLYELKLALPSTKTVSIAAPASYWYLKNFPIDAIGVVVDYIIFMTYDFHGQWDYGNTFSDPGCPLGNCLRSHVNLTETVNAISMITKALVPSNKVVAGLASYGRSFQMVEAGCTGETCFYTGPLSGATPGQCTATAGYLAEAEINAIISSESTSTWRDTSLSNIMVYNNTQWVSYMDPANKAIRLSLFQAYSLGGSTEWAIDLAATIDGDSTAGTGDNTGNSTAPCDYSLTFSGLAALEAVADNYPIYCVEVYTLQALSADLAQAYVNYTSVDNDYDKYFGYYVQYVYDIVPDTITNYMGYLGADGPGNVHFQCSKSSTMSSPVACPILGSDGLIGSFDVYYQLMNSTGFYADLLALGIESDWITIGIENQNSCYFTGVSTACTDYGQWHNYPIQNTSMVVPNPKDIVTAAGPNMTIIANQISATSIDAMMGQWNGSALDAVEVLAMPVVMIEQAIASMQTAKNIGETTAKDDKISLILGILGVVFAVVPFLGEEGATLMAATSLARIIALVGEAANAGLGIYSIVEDHSSAPMVIFGMLLGIGGLARDGENMAMMAKLRRAMDPEVLTKMGTLFTDNAALIQKMARVCGA